jgi:5-methylcytosine-specific restriction enzyme subunit McrC
VAIRTESSVGAVVVAEYQTAVVQCDAATAARIHADKHLQIAPMDISGHYEIRARHKVGVLRYGELEIRVIPKISVTRLLYLASFHENDSSWRQLEALLGEASDPLSAIVQALLFHCERALRPVPLQGYVNYETAITSIRGRVLFERQIAAQAGVELPVHVRFDEYEANIVENRIVKAALQVVARFDCGSYVAARLRHLINHLDGVRPWIVGQKIPAIVFSRLNERYRGAIALSRLVLEQRSLEYNQRQTSGTAFLFNMNHLFESFLEVSLQKLLQARRGRVERQKSIALDIDERILLRPDLTWWDGGRCLAVVDAKYKGTKNADAPNADVYQILAYCNRLGLSRGYLVYADMDGEEPGSYSVRNADVEIIVSSIDLGGSIEMLNRSVECLADMIFEAVAGAPELR